MYQSSKTKKVAKYKNCPCPNVTLVVGTDGPVSLPKIKNTQIQSKYKTDLLRKHKRHTVCHMPSIYSAVLSPWGGGGTPSCACWKGSPSSPDWGEGVPHPVLARGYPILSYLAAPHPVLVWDWGTAPPPPSLIWDQSLGYPSRKDMESVEVLWDKDIMGWIWGIPRWTDRHLWKQYLSHPSDTDVNKLRCCPCKNA